MKNKKKKRKIRFKGLIVIVLVAYLLGNVFYYLWKMPIKSINITGNYYLKDNYLVNYLNIDNKSIIKVSKNDIKKKLLELDLISDAKVKKNLLGTLNINITEEKILFYNRNIKKIVLTSQKEIENNNEYLGVPTLINYVKEDVYKELINKLEKVDREILALVSEIEYNPSVVNEKIVDDKRFLFRMNDGNIVYINTTNIEKINNYLEVYEGIVNKNGDVKGCLYLDSNSDNKHFNLCKEAKQEEAVNNG